MKQHAWYLLHHCATCSPRLYLEARGLALGSPIALGTHHCSAMQKSDPYNLLLGAFSDHAATSAFAAENVLVGPGLAVHHARLCPWQDHCYPRQSPRSAECVCRSALLGRGYCSGSHSQRVGSLPPMRDDMLRLASYLHLGDGSP